MITAIRKEKRDGLGIGRDGGCEQCAEDLWTESAGRPIIELKIAGRVTRICEGHADRLVLTVLDALPEPPKRTVGEILTILRKGLRQ